MAGLNPWYNTWASPNQDGPWTYIGVLSAPGLRSFSEKLNAQAVSSSSYRWLYLIDDEVPPTHHLIDTATATRYVSYNQGKAWSLAFR